MSEITLSVLRGPEGVVMGQRRATGGEISLGRDAKCDWQLPDPDRVVSSRHCVLEYFGGAWQVRDVSTNGTFVNHGATPVGRDQVRPLMDGDRLRLGAYEIEVRIAEAAEAPGWGAPTSYKADPFAEAPVTGFDGAARPGMGGGLLPDDFDPFSDNAAPMADHAPSTAEAFMVPPALPAGKAVIPDDWDLDLNPAPRRAPPPTENPFTEPNLPPPPAAPRLPPVAAAPVVAQPTSLPPASLPPAAPVAPQSSGHAAAGLAALLDGAGLPPAMAAHAQQDPEATLRAAGAVLRAAIAGMRALLIARADVKREFRIEQTMLRAANNNPLKFAATDEQALAALLDPRSPALPAMQETVDDLTAHQVATLAATQAAARALLARLAPGPIEAGDPGGGLLPGAKEKRLWDAYKRRHAELEAQFDDDFDSAFGKAFARAYEQATGRKDY